MGLEIERKFLVKDESWKELVEQTHSITQGYLNLDPKRNVRVRVKNQKGYLTIKGITEGISRQEFEYEVPLKDAKELLSLCEGNIIDKKRHTIRFDKLVWEIDEFFGAHKGLLLAELELENERQTFVKPSFVGKEVSSNEEYFNASLAQKK